MRSSGSDVERRLARRLASLRSEAGWSLGVLAKRSGVSRATLSRVERGEVSPTATVLGSLCAAFGRTMSMVLAEVEVNPSQLVRAGEQPVWVDRVTGFRRRMVSPPAADFQVELVEGELPSGKSIEYAMPPVVGLEQHLWVLKGALELTLDGVTRLLRVGDCLRFRLAGTSRFRAKGARPARYLLAVRKS